MNTIKRAILLSLAVLVALGTFTACSPSTKTYVVLQDNFGSEEYGIGFRHGDYALMMAVQTILDEIYTDGSAAEVSKKWFGEDVILRDSKYPVEPQVLDTDTSLQYIKDKGKIILGLDANYPPMGFTDSTTGDIVGFDIDLAKLVAEKLGVELVLQPIDWSAKEMELKTKNIDMIWNGLTINESRIKEMTFSKPYLANSQIIIVEEGSDIKTKADLKGKIIGLQDGSSSYNAVEADAEIYPTVKDAMIKFQDNLTAFLDLKAGRIDAFVVDMVLGRYILAND